MFVPGIVWDKEGYRLGWGRGYFDRVLKTLPEHVRSIGLSFSLQLVNRVPRGHFALPASTVVTESRAVRCHTRPRALASSWVRRATGRPAREGGARCPTSAL